MKASNSYVLEMNKIKEFNSKNNPIFFFYHHYELYLVNIQNLSKIDLLSKIEEIDITNSQKHQSIQIVHSNNIFVKEFSGKDIFNQQYIITNYKLKPTFILDLTHSCS